MLTRLIVLIISNIYKYYIFCLPEINVLCQLYLHKKKEVENDPGEGKTLANPCTRAL